MPGLTSEGAFFYNALHTLPFGVTFGVITPVLTVTFGPPCLCSGRPYVCVQVLPITMMRIVYTQHTTTAAK